MVFLTIRQLSTGDESYWDYIDPKLEQFTIKFNIIEFLDMN